MNIEFSFTLALPQFLQFRDKESALIVARRSKDFRREHRVFLVQLAQFNQSAMLQAFNISPFALQHRVASNVESPELIQTVSLLCMRTPIAWYNLATFIQHNNLDLWTLAALDYSTLLSEGVPMNALLELLHSADLLATGCKSYYYAEHIITLGTYSIFGSGNALLLLQHNPEASTKPSSQCPPSNKKMRLVTAPLARGRMVRLHLPPVHLDVLLQPDLQSCVQTAQDSVQRQQEEVGVITCVSSLSVSVTTTTHVYTSVSWSLISGSQPYDADISSFLLQGVILSVEYTTADSSVVQRKILSVQLHRSYISEFADVLSIEQCTIPSGSSATYAWQSEGPGLLQTTSSPFTILASPSTVPDMTSLSKTLKDVLWAAVGLRVTVSGHNFSIMALSRLSRWLYEVLMQIGHPLYCLWTVSDLSCMALKVYGDISTAQARTSSTHSFLSSGLLLVDLQLPLRCYGRIHKKKEALFVDVDTSGREYQLFNISAAQYKNLVTFISRTSAVTLSLNPANVSTLWPDVTVTPFASTTTFSGNVNGARELSSIHAKIVHQRPYTGCYSQFACPRNRPCHACLSTEDHEVLLRTEQMSCSIYGGATGWEAVACAHVIHFTVPIFVEIFWRANVLRTVLSTFESHGDKDEPSPHIRTVRNSVVQALAACEADSSDSESPQVHLHMNTLLDGVLRYVHSSSHLASALPVDTTQFPVLKEGDSLIAKCTDVDFFFSGESICITKIEVVSMCCEGCNTIPFNVNSIPSLNSERLPIRTAMMAVPSTPELCSDATDLSTNPFLIGDGINLSVPKNCADKPLSEFVDMDYAELRMEGLNGIDFVAEAVPPLMHDSPSQSGVNQFDTAVTPTYSRCGDSTVLFPLTNSNSNSIPTFPILEGITAAPTNPFFSSAMSTPQQSLFPIITSITDGSELSSDAYSYMTQHTLCDHVSASCHDDLFSAVESAQESIDVLSTMDFSRHLLFGQDLGRIDPKSVRTVVGYVRYHFPNFNLAIISFEDSLRSDGWMHSLSVWHYPVVLQRSRVIYSKKTGERNKLTRGESENSLGKERVFFARARVRCTVVPFTETSSVYMTSNVVFLDYENALDKMSVTKEASPGKSRRGRRTYTESQQLAPRKVIHASVYWQENAKENNVQTSFGFVRLCNGYERHFAINSMESYLGHLVSITITANSKNHKNTCELQGSLLRPPTQQHWLMGRLVLLLRGRECEQISKHVLDLMAVSFRSKIAPDTFNSIGKTSNMMLTMGFIITESHQNTHVDCSFFRLVLPKPVANRLEVGMLLRYTLKEGAYHKVIDTSDSLYSSPCDLLNDILATGESTVSEPGLMIQQYTRSRMDNGDYLYMAEQSAVTEAHEGNSKRLSCWAVDSISLLDDTFKGTYKNIEARKCRGIEPEETFFTRYNRYLLPSRALLIYLPRPALDVDPPIFWPSDTYSYLVHFVYNEQKQGISAEASLITKMIPKSKAPRHVGGYIHPIIRQEIGHNSKIFVFVSESARAAGPVDSSLDWLQRCIAPLGRIDSKDQGACTAYLVSKFALFVLHSRLLSYAKQVMNFEEATSAQEWAHTVMHSITTGKMPVIASDMCLSLIFMRELFMGDTGDSSFTLRPTARHMHFFSTVDDEDILPSLLSKPCAWFYTTQTISVRSTILQMVTLPLKPANLLTLETKDPEQAFSYKNLEF